MEIRLYKQFVKRINSTKLPNVSYDTKSVRQKEETSVISPTFLLTGYHNDYNYIFVPRWGRYYFINDVKLNIEGLFEISCTLDVLASYKDSIGATKTFIERTSDLRHISPFIRDNAISCEDRVVSTESEVTECFPSATVYILRVMGRGSTNGIGTFVVSYQDIKNIFSGVWGQIDDDSISDYIKGLCNLYINDPSQYIVGVYRSPIGITKYREYGTEDAIIYVGGHKTDLEADVRVDNPNAVIFSGRELKKPINMYNDWRATDPAFSQYTLYIPTIGMVPLPAEIMHMTLKMTLCADLFSGDLSFILYADGDVVATYTSNCYASVSVGVQNGSAGSSILSGALGVAGGVSLGNIAITTANAINGVKSFMSPPSSVLGTQGSLGAIEKYPDFIITCMQKSSSDFPTDVYGRPCEKNLTINNLKGYIKCQNASISNIAGMDREKSYINDYLNNGFYFE